MSDDTYTYPAEVIKKSNQYVLDLMEERDRLSAENSQLLLQVKEIEGIVMRMVTSGDGDLMEYGFQIRDVLETDTLKTLPKASDPEGGT